MKPRSFIWIALCAGWLGLAAARLAAGTAEVTVDFSKVETVLSPLTFSMCASGYGGEGGQLPRQPGQQERLAALRVAMMRINLGYRTPGDPASGLVCLASGSDATIDGLDWLAAIRRSGAVPAVRLQMNPAVTPDIWVADAVSMVRQFNARPETRIDRWVIGNEPDAKKNGHTLESYTAGFIAIFQAMKAVDPAIQIGGPATASYQAAEDGFLKSFLRNLHAAGIVPDFVDFHTYGTGTNPITDADLLAVTKRKYLDEPADMRRFLITMWGPEVGGKMQMELGEWNLSWRSDARQLQHFATVWSALSLSYMVKSNLISRQYADKNGALGAVAEVANPGKDGVVYPAAVNDPMPIYHGIGMFTGEGLFRGFGREVVAVASSSDLVNAAASRDPRNIVVINSSPSDAAETTFTLAGVTAATVEVWQKNPENRDPVHLGAVAVAGGRFSYRLQPYTVTTFLVGAATDPR